VKLQLKTIFALSIIPQIILVKWLGSYPQLVEKYYSEGIYPILSRFLRTLFGWIPFSMGDIFYTLLVLSLIRYLWLRGKKLYQKPKETLRHLGITISIAYFIFHLFWGMNYYRYPVNEKLGFKVDYTTAELITFTRKMIDYTNTLQFKLAKDVSKPIHIPYRNKDIFAKTLHGYGRAADIYPILEYNVPSLKPSLFSTALTYMGYGGYLNPFTNEAQVNAIIPKLRLPSISGHEVGHQLGYSSESSTNFIGLIVTYCNDDPYFKYASLSHLLAYCLSDLKKKDSKAFEVLYSELNEGVKKNYKELNNFWASYQNPTEPVFKALFNSFLKINNQEKGIQSYNAVVGLLINFNPDFWYDHYWKDLYLQS